MSGAVDMVLVFVPLDAPLTDVAFAVGRNRIVVNRMDSAFQIRFGGITRPRISISDPFEFEDCDSIVDFVYITTAAAVPGGAIELTCTSLNTRFGAP